jgi:NTE family protein
MYRLRFVFIMLFTYLVGCAVQQPLIYIPPVQPKITKVVESPRVALVLGGGGARGYAHLGVLKALEEAHIPIDLIVGVSAGSIIGSLYADCPRADIVTYTLMNASYSSFVDLSLRSLNIGPITGSKLQHFLLTNSKARDFKDLKIKFVAVTTDLNTGRTVALEAGPIAPAVNASAALPSIVKPVRMYGETFVDGGVTDPVPVDIAKRYSPKMIIAVNIAAEPRPQVYRSPVGIMSQTMDLMMGSLSKLCAEDADIYIHPKVGPTSLFDLSVKKEMYHQGYTATKKAIPMILRKLKAL